MKGFHNLTKMLCVGGTLYISFPIGTRGTHFNAHRVFSPTEILKWADGIFNLVDYQYVNDNGDLIKGESAYTTPEMIYGCGIYTFKKSGLKSEVQHPDFH